MKKKILAIIVQVNQWINERPIVKRTVGVILVLLGLAALITPITPGSWLLLIGLEFLGLRIILRDWALKQKYLYIDREK